MRQPLVSATVSRMPVGDQIMMCPSASTRSFPQTQKVGLVFELWGNNKNILLVRYIHGTLFTPWSVVSLPPCEKLFSISSPNCVSAVCMLMRVCLFCCVKRNKKRLPIRKKKQPLLVTEEQRARGRRRQKRSKWKSECWESISVWDPFRVELNIGFVSLFAGLILGTKLSRLEEYRTKTHVRVKMKKWLKAGGWFVLRQCLFRHLSDTCCSFHSWSWDEKEKKCQFSNAAIYIHNWLNENQKKMKKVFGSLQFLIWNRR